MRRKADLQKFKDLFVQQVDRFQPCHLMREPLSIIRLQQLRNAEELTVGPSLLRRNRFETTAYWRRIDSIHHAIALCPELAPLQCTRCHLHRRRGSVEEILVRCFKDPKLAPVSKLRVQQLSGSLPRSGECGRQRKRAAALPHPCRQVT